MDAVYLGSGSFGLPSLEALKHSDHRLLGIVTGADKPQGRSLKPRPNPVKDWALKERVPVIGAEEAARSGADVFIAIAYGVILPEPFIRIPKFGTLNVHASLLPKYRGASPIHAALLAGDAETGVCVMRMVRELDAGDVLTVERTAISPDDDFVTLESRLSALGARALIAALNDLASGRAAFRSQDPAGVSYARRISKDDARIDWSQPAERLFNQIRAYRHWPKAFCRIGDKRLLLLASRVCDAERGADHPGQLLDVSAREGLRVSTGRGTLQLLEVQMEGRRAMTAAEFASGSGLKPGDTLE